jgi:monoamine oxidase
MLTKRIAIIGGGLSGLYAASLLEQQGIHDYVLLEARDTFGGRIMSVQADTSDARYDLGATWFWPALNPELSRVIDALGLQRFAQFETGDMVVERSLSSPPLRAPGYASGVPAMRLVGGMAALTDALYERLTPTGSIAGHRVRRLRHVGDAIELEAYDAFGSMLCHRVGHVLLAVPPRLASTTIDFTPMLPDATIRQWQSCDTWMAPHAKYVAVFDTPFWRDQGLSGEARSAIGPLGEIHDASAHTNGGALFGFLGVPAQVRSRTLEATLLAHCRAQLARLFGDRAGAPRAEFLKDWASDPYTAVIADHTPDSRHGALPPPATPSGAWQDRLTGIASEWSPSFSGYAAGALDAAQRGVAAVLARLAPISA